MRHLLITMTILTIAAACKNKTEQSQDARVQTTPSEDYRKLGDSLSIIAQKTLLSNVSEAMGKGGPSYAVDFCHENATAIMDSITKESIAGIQRISFKNRNPKNAPIAASDSAILKYYALQQKQGTIGRDTVITGIQQTLYYKPIVLGMPACLKCHGSPGKDIDANTLALLQNKYPEDKATGYKIGDMRGAWKISFPK